jgi:hypothetical protein
VSNRRIAIGLLLALVIAAGACLAIRTNSEPGGQWTAIPEVVELKREKQESIWDAEHVAFEIEARFGKPFLAALREHDAATLRGFFDPRCGVSLLDDAKSQTRQVSVVSESRRERSTSPSSAGDVARLVQTLVESLATFDVVDRIGLRALKVREDREAPQRWKTRLLVTAHGTNAEGQPMAYESEHEVDFRFEETAKIPIAGAIVDWSVELETLRTASKPLMQEVTEAYGLGKLNLPDNWKLPVDEVALSHFQMAVEDFDRDGFLDIVIQTKEGASILLKSEQGKGFVDITSQMPFLRCETPSTLVVWIDYDNDGFPDLFLGDRMYHNVNGQRFEPLRHQSTLDVAHDPTGAAVADYDCDGLLDVYVVYDNDGESANDGPWVGDEQSGMLNHLWRNEGNGVFKNVTIDASADGGSRLSFAASWLFLDDDRFPDLYIANDFGNNVLLRNSDQGIFVDVARSVGTGDFATSMGVATGDLNNDGRPEIYVANMYSKMGRRILDHICEEDYPAGIYEQILGSCAGNRLYTQAPGELKFREISDEMGVNAVGWAYSPAMADFDNNGWLDLYATTGYLSFDRKKPDG